MLILVLMTLTLMQGHIGSTKVKIQCWIILTTKQATGIKLTTTEGHFLCDRNFANIYMDWPSCCLFVVVVVVVMLLFFFLSKKILSSSLFFVQWECMYFNMHWSVHTCVLVYNPSAIWFKFILACMCLYYVVFTPSFSDWTSPLPGMI